jgi:DNA-binding transcriptional ArsR family regulator
MDMIEEDTYSIIFKALKHPIRRKILRELSQKSLTYTDIQSLMNIDNGLLNYHLDNMKELIFKGKDGKYSLSEFGKGAINLEENVEEPINRNKSWISSNPNKIKAILILLVVAFSSSFGFLIYFTQKPIKTSETVTSETVQALVMRANSIYYSNGSNLIEYNGILKLITKDTINGLEIGEIGKYQINTREPIELGYLITGHTSKEGANLIFTSNSSSPFQKEFVNVGYYVDLWSISLIPVYPYSIKFGISNLGEKNITSIRCSLNGTILPFSLGVSSISPIKPNEDWSGRVYTSWLDPSSDEIKGITLERSKIYKVNIDITFSDGVQKYFERNVRAIGPGSIESFVGSRGIDQIDVDLMNVNLWDSSLLSVSFRNVWYNQSITNIELDVDGKIVISENTNLIMGKWWVGSMKMPFDVFEAQTYNVTIRVTSNNGNNYSEQLVVLCQRLN